MNLDIGTAELPVIEVTIPNVLPVVEVTELHSVEVNVFQELPSVVDITTSVPPNATVIGLPGPPGEDGPPGPQGPQGPPGTVESMGYRHIQNLPSTEWVIDHGLNYPTVTVVDTAGDVIIPTIVYTSATQVILYFSAAVAGEAYFC